MKLIKLITITTIITTALFSKQLENISLQLLWKHQFEFAGFYIAKEKGFYEDSGLNLEIKEFEFGKNITNDVENEISTFGIGYPNIILDKSNGSNIVLLNAIFQSSPHVLISLKSSGINSIEDFKQKNIMIENDVIKTAPILSMLYSKNIKIEDMNRVNPSFNIGNLVSGKVDITTSYLSNEIYKLDKSNIKYNIFNPKDYGFDFYNDILFTSYNIAKNNPVMVKQFQNATLKGWEYAFNNIDETIDIILKIKQKKHYYMKHIL
ncbi:MAG: ABC transporter substrate-binding protein [Campylobacterota bacterium]|nr:ABC transporter substrate-binding protein [Campylobacterota bacterium]